MVLEFYPSGEVVQAAVQNAAEAIGNGGGVEGLADLVNAMGVVAGWNPVLVYGGIGLGMYKALSECVEVVYEKACYQVALNEMTQGI